MAAGSLALVTTTNANANFNALSVYNLFGWYW